MVFIYNKDDVEESNIESETLDPLDISEPAGKKAKLGPTCCVYDCTSKRHQRLM